ncbi:MAG: 23S rRNA (adenine(2503)-C(2))-methyltransferase RlmN [Flavobacteriales bacterium]
MQQKKDIRTYSLEKLKSFFNEHNEKSFRAQQVYEWIWGKHCSSFEEMTNLSKKTRAFLHRNFTISITRLQEEQKSEDGTIKNVFRCNDGKIMEGVLIPSEGRMTACVSSQVGCSLACEFCATARLKRERNLIAGEIYDQVKLINDQAVRHYNTALTNIVYMGMGEPLLNYKEVIKSIEHITSNYGLAMSPKRITFSTVGIAKMIEKLGDEEVKFNLALSLHAANDEARNKIMAINKKNDLSTLAEALKHFYNKTGTKVTYEYIVFKDINDKEENALELVEFCNIIPCKVNIIEYNPIDNGTLKQAEPEKLDMYKDILEKNGIIVNVRRSRGKDIDAACGQLANKNKATEMDV